MLADLKKRKLKQVKWVDSLSRFTATVCQTQDDLPFVCLDLRGTRIDHSAFSDIIEDLFIPLEEVIVLYPYQPRNAMLILNPSLYEVTIHVKNFWNAVESGGNSGKPARNGTMMVSGETWALQRLRGERDTRFTKPQIGLLNTDESGVRGTQNTLKGGLVIRRAHKNKLESTSEVVDGEVSSAWVCVNYSSNHNLYCTSIPPCSHESDETAVGINASCVLDDLFLNRQQGDSNDTDAIAIKCKSQGTVVGFCPRELAACLAPLIDSGLLKSQENGVYSEHIPKGLAQNRVWFRFDIDMSSSGQIDEHYIQKRVSAIPWWVSVQ
jgi:hypothetical protein